ncbi:glycosyltransferase family 4 protein [Desulfocapsa sp. AH-315-G09]|nr:glycosyltransferase family 4 protein [Desulfocapsa sp. AH-315-G09]
MILASGDLWAGAEVMVYQLASGLAKIPNLDLLVVLLNKGRLAEELQKIGVEVQMVDESIHSFAVLSRAIRKKVAEFSPNIIHSHRYKENLLAWLSVLGKKGVGLVSTQHGMPETVGGDISLAGRLRTGFFFRLLSCCFDCTVLVSEEMRLLLIGSYGFSKNNVAVIHNGISIPKDSSRRSAERLVVGSAGRLFPVKDFTLFVDVANLVVAQNDMVDFVIAGDGPQRIMLEDMVRSNGLQEHFRFLGHQGDMDAFYRSLDVYINTSVHEGIPMSVLEAMSYGLPVVVPEVGGFPEIVKDGEQGFLIKGRQKKEYADRVLELVVNSELRLQMATSARKRVVDFFSRDAMAQAYFDVYSRVRRS